MDNNWMFNPEMVREQLKLLYNKIISGDASNDEKYQFWLFMQTDTMDEEWRLSMLTDKTECSSEEVEVFKKLIDSCEV